MKKVISAALIFVEFFYLLGCTGSFELEKMSFGAFFARAVISIAITYIGFRLLNKGEAWE